MGLLLPLAHGRWVDDFFLIMEPYAPQLRGLVEAFPAKSGVVCENYRLFVEGSRVLSCTLVKFDAARFVLTITDVSEQVEQEHRLERALRAEADKAVAELQMVKELNADLDRLSRQLRKARDRAERADRAKSRFLAGMSHELRTPLNGIMGYAHLLRIEGGLNPVQEARVDAMLEAGRHLLEMIACVLDLSEIEAEHTALKPVAVDPGAIAEACLKLVGPLAEKKSLTLSLAIQSGFISKALLDPTRLRQILLNLLGNAVKFTTQGEVAVRLAIVPGQSRIRIEVADTGPGISADQQQRLFQEFERLDIEADPTAEGAGLGLVLSSRITNLMGGTLGYDNNPGGGAIFWLEVPFDVPATILAETAPAADPAVAQPAPQTRPLQVLVVDDVMMNREIAGSFLRADGYDVAFAEGGVEAVAAAANTDFDCVLMDVRMPGMDGLEATRRIRLLEGARGRVPIVALTAQAFADQIAECRQAGMDTHLGKPYDPVTLHAAVTQAIEIGLRRKLNDDPAPAPTMKAVSPADPPMGSDLPLLDLKAFDRTAGFLAPEAVSAYLGTIVTLGESVLLGLRGPEGLTSDDPMLADTVHKLAGSAGMFGFQRVAGLARRFERALQTRTSDASALAGGLRAAIEASIKEGVLVERGRDGWALAVQSRVGVRNDDRPSSD